MNAISEEEEFEFRLRAEREAGAQPPSSMGATPAASPSLVQSMIAPYRNLAETAIEVPLALGSGLAGMVAGNIAGAGKEVLSGDFGKGTGERTAKSVAEAMTYAPRNPVAQEVMQGIGRFMQSDTGKLVQGLPIAGQELPQIARATRQGVPAAAELTGAKITAPSQKLVEFARQNQPKIEAGKKAQQLGLVYDVADTNPTLGNVVGAEFVRPEILDLKASAKNLPKIQRILREEAGVEGDTLTGAALQAARERISAPYNEVKKIGSLAPNAALANDLRSALPKPVVGLEKQVKEGSRVVNEVAAAIEEGRMTASEAVDAIRADRSQASNWYKVAEKGDAKRNPTEIAKAYGKVADTLENLIEANIPPSSSLLTRFKDARTSLAKNYAVEGLINTESGIPDLTRFNSARFATAPLTGKLADLRAIQANLPEAVQSVSKYGAVIPSTISRASPSGTVGTGVAMAAGASPGLGGILGAASGLLGGRFYANRMLSPEFQAKNALPRVPGPRRAEPVAPPSTAIVPFVQSGAFQPSSQVPNWTFGSPTAPVDVQVVPPNTRGMLSYTPNAEMIRPRTWANRSKVMEAEAAAAEAAASRRPASGGTLFDFDPMTGKLKPVSEGVRGATPAVIANLGGALKSAVEKLSSGRGFALTAEERLAWAKASPDIKQAVADSLPIDRAAWWRPSEADAYWRNRGNK